MESVPQDVIEALAQVRDSGAINMFDRNGVINIIALDFDDWGVADWLQDNKARYMDALNAMGEYVTERDGR